MPFEMALYSPGKTVVKRAKMIILPGLEGNLGVLSGHAPIITALKPGKMRVVGEDFEEYYNIGFGLAEVLPDRTTIITEDFSKFEA